MAVCAETGKPLTMAASVNMVEIQDSNICVAAVFAAVPLATGSTQRGCAVATTQATVSARV